MPEVITRRRGPSKPGGGKPKNRDERKVQRHEDAEKRQAVYDQLTPEQKLDRLRPFGPRTKEWLKLTALGLAPKENHKK